MRKIGVIFLSVLLLSSCAVFRKAGTASSGIGMMSRNDTIPQGVIQRNISSDNIYIEKADIDVDYNGFQQRLLGSIKFEKEGIYLVSLRSRTGIEGARIFLNKDSAYLNDRINKKLYSGSSRDLERKFGISQNLLPLIFGDIVTEKSVAKSGLCINDEFVYKQIIRGIPVVYKIGCDNMKLSDALVMTGYSQTGINFKFERIKRKGNYIYPEIITIRDERNSIFIKIKVLKIDFSWTGNIVFIPGKGYKREQIR